MILCKVAEKINFCATGAASFDEAAQLLRKGDFDCITLDLSLGDRAGVEVLWLLSELESRIPVIIISGSEAAILDETTRTGKSFGLDIRSTISKPVDLSVFRDELMKIGVQKLARALA
jgi:DNA-binding response OmpR family regulator